MNEEEIKKIIQDEGSKIDPTIDEETINKINELRNENIDYKKRLLSILDNLKDMGVEIEYSESMTTEELQKLVDKIKV